MAGPDPDEQFVRRRWWVRVVGMAWFVAFLWWFYGMTLSNAQLIDGEPFSRRDVWLLLPDLLLANVPADPLPGASPSGWRFLPQRFDLLAVAAFILAGAWGLGSLTLRGLGVRGQFDAPTRLAFAFALGLSGASLLTLGCGLAGLLNRWLLGGLLILFLLGEIVVRLRGDSSQAAASRPSGDEKRRAFWTGRRWDVLPTICLVAVAPFVLAMLLGALLPSTDFDVKEYHLEGPKEYYQQGRVTFLSHNVYTSFPFLTEMLSLLAMALRDDWFRGALAGKTVLMTMAPLTALALFAAGRRWFGSSVGWLCVVVYLTIPWVYRISIIAYAEGGLTCYLFTTLLAVMWLTHGEDSVRSTQYSVLRPQSSASSRLEVEATDTGHWPTGHVLLCGLLAGSAASCKYPGLLSVVVPLGGFLVFQAWRRQRSTDTSKSLADDSVPRRLRTAAVTASVFTLGILITFGPWTAKNVVQTGNPVYPLLYGVFGGRDWNEADHAKWQNGHPPMIRRFIEDPASIPGNFLDRVRDVVGRSDWQSPLLFALAPLALGWSGRRRLVLQLWGYVGWLFLVWWMLTHHIDRFWIPMLPVVTLLSGVGVGWLLGMCNDSAEIDRNADDALSWSITAAVTALIGAAALFNLGYVTTKMCGYNAYLTDFDSARRNATTPMIGVLNQHLSDDARVLFVGAAEVFDAEFDYVYNTVFDHSIFEDWTSAAQPGVASAEQPLRPANEIRETFRQHGITHVFVDWNEVLRHRVPAGYGFTDFVTPDRFLQMESEGILESEWQSWRPWDTLDQAAQAEVDRWGPSLRAAADREKLLLQYQLFVVR